MKLKFLNIIVVLFMVAFFFAQKKEKITIFCPVPFLAPCVQQKKNNPKLKFSS